jgi:hypothetical protein
MSLNVLPDEILADIFQLLGEQTDYDNELVKDGTLYKVALCSRRLNKVATPMLYRTFIQTRHSTLKKFLCRVLEEPKLRGFVRRLGTQQLIKPETTPFEYNDPNGYETAIRAVGLDSVESHNWITAVKAGDWDAIIALLFVLLPNLEEIHTLSWKVTIWIKKILGDCGSAEHQEKPRRYLAHVKTLYVIHWYDMPGGYTLEDISHFLKLGSLQSANFEGVRHQTRLQGQPLSCSLENLRSLSFEGSYIDSYMLKNFLRSCPNLQRLTHKHSVFPKVPNLFVPHRVKAGLSGVRKSLQELRLSDKSYEGQSQRPFGSLVKFEVLKNLAMDASILFGYLASGKSILRDSDTEDDNIEQLGDYVKLIEILPASLESLEITQCWDVMDMKNQITELLGKKEDVVPLLKSICIMVNSDFEHQLGVIQELTKIFEDAGIELEAYRSGPPYLGEMEMRCPS